MGKVRNYYILTALILCFTTQQNCAPPRDREALIHDLNLQRLRATGPSIIDLTDCRSMEEASISCDIAIVFSNTCCGIDYENWAWLREAVLNTPGIDGAMECGGWGRPGETSLCLTILNPVNLPLIHRDLRQALSVKAYPDQSGPVTLYPEDVQL